MSEQVTSKITRRKKSEQVNGGIEAIESNGKIKNKMKKLPSKSKSTTQGFLFSDEPKCPFQSTNTMNFRVSSDNKENIAFHNQSFTIAPIFNNNKKLFDSVLCQIERSSLNKNGKKSRKKYSITDKYFDIYNMLNKEEKEVRSYKINSARTKSNFSFLEITSNSHVASTDLYSADIYNPHETEAFSERGRKSLEILEHAKYNKDQIDHNLSYEEGFWSKFLNLFNPFKCGKCT
jgi:hypothetical protein